jgi:hypothetical protein
MAGGSPIMARQRETNSFACKWARVSEADDLVSSGISAFLFGADIRGCPDFRFAAVPSR